MRKNENGNRTRSAELFPDCEYYTYEGMGHLVPTSNRAEIMERIIDFIKK